MRTIVYLMSGPAHLPYLAVSLHTLRTHWSGEILVAAWPESYYITKQICRDPEIEAQYVSRTPSFRGRGSNDQFIDKILLVREMSRYDSILYLDADTSIHGKLDQLFDAAELYGFAATQFCQWRTTSRVVRNRVKRLEQWSEIDQFLLNRIITEDHPSLNGGVWASLPTSPVLSVWRSWSIIADSIFIADESVLHLLQLKDWGDESFHVMTGGRWNCSPKYQPKDLPDESIVVRHYHGDCAVRPEKSEKGVALWAPLFQRVLDQNIGGIRNWHKIVGNKRLNQCVEKGILG